MIEELTPQVLMRSLVLILLLSPVLTTLLCLLCLWLYRRAVTRSMEAIAGYHHHDDTRHPSQINHLFRNRSAHVPRTTQLFDDATRAPFRDLARYGLAMLVAASVFASAAQFVFPTGLGVQGFLIGLWIYLWPLWLALPLIVPTPLRLWLACVAGYIFVYALLSMWASTIENIPEYQTGGIYLPERSGVTPFTMVQLWHAVNTVPSVLALLCFNRRVRAVAPLMLALVSIATSGAWFGLIAFTSPPLKSLFERLSERIDVGMMTVIFTAFAVLLGALAVLGWKIARLIATRYRARQLSDRSLLIDSMWLVFACMYAMWLLMGGLAWIATLPVAYIVYKLILFVTRPNSAQADRSHGLTFLRVFSLGRRSEALLDELSKTWRYLGSIQLISGPDVAHSTVQPHQFLDFLSGKLARHFVGDRHSLDRSLAERDFSRDPDGRFRINSLFCHEDAWQPALPHFVAEGDTVLMDLRSFSPANNGCIHELKFLAQQIPLEHCLFIIDDTTDEAFIEHTLGEELNKLPPSSPNAGRSPAEFERAHLGQGNHAVHELVRRLVAMIGQGRKPMA